MARTTKSEAAAAAEKIVISSTPSDNDLVPFKAPLGRAGEQPLIVGVNGKNTAIPKDGKIHMVSRAVAFELEHSMEAEEKFFRKQQQLIDESKIV